MGGTFLAAEVREKLSAHDDSHWEDRGVDPISHATKKPAAEACCFGNGLFGYLIQSQAPGDTTIRRRFILANPVAQFQNQDRDSPPKPLRNSPATQPKRELVGVRGGRPLAQGPLC